MSETTILFARPSFWEGMARVLDLGNTLNVYNESSTEWEADAKALASDWNVIAQDYRNSFDEAVLGQDVAQPSEQE